MGDLSAFQRLGLGGAPARDDSWLLGSDEPEVLDGFVRKWTLADSVFKSRPAEADSKSW